MEWSESKTNEYLDEFKIIKHLGSGYQAQFFFINLESNWLQTARATLLPLKNTNHRHLLSILFKKS